MKKKKKNCNTGIPILHLTAYNYLSLAAHILRKQCFDLYSALIIFKTVVSTRTQNSCEFSQNSKAKNYNFSISSGRKQ